MIIDSPIVSGSQLASGPFTQIGNVQITGSLSVTGTINGSITGSITSASYATYAETASYAVGYALDNNVVHLSGNQSIAGEKSFDNVVTIYESSGIRFTDNPLTTNYGSIQGNQYFWQFTAGADTLLFRSKNSVNALSVDAAGNSTMTSVTANSFTGSLLGTASYAANANSTSASFAAYSASVSTRLTTDEANITTLTNASGSFAAQSASLSTRLTTDESNFNTTSGSLSTRVTNLESTSSTVSSSFASTSGSIAGRVTTIESKYATTGSNTFSNLQYISSSTNAQGFTTTASLYTDGGLRVSKDSYVSGTAYFNNVVVYGTSSIQYLTSSQVNVGANIINLNTQTPALRYGGMAVADSGSNAGVTGSLLWDSVNNRWIYSNPSGSTYDGGMLISGPRNTTGLGNELGTTSCALMMGQGGDHITSSAIFSYGNATCFYGQSYISGSGDSYFAGNIGVQNTSPSGGLHIVNPTEASAWITSTGGDYDSSIYLGYCFPGNALFANTYIKRQVNSLVFGTTNNNRLTIDFDGVVTSACQVCAPAFVGGTVSGTTGTFSSNVVATGSLIVAPSSNVEFQVRSTGVTIGNALTDVHQVTGSLNVTGSFRTIGNSCFTSVCSPAFIGGTVDGSIINSTSNIFRFSGNNALSLVSLNAQNVVKINAAGYWGTQLVGANDQGILINNSGNVGIGTLCPSYTFDVCRSVAADFVARIANPSSTGFGLYVQANDNTKAGIRIANNVGATAIDLLGSGIACFSNTVCSPSFISSGTICSTGNTCFGGMTIVANCLGVGTSTPAYKVQVAVAQNSGGAVANRNSCSGTAAYAAYFLGNDAADNGGGITLFSSVYTPANSYPIDGTYVYSNRPGGVAIIAEHVTSALSLGAGNCSRMCISSVGITTFTCQVCTPNLISTDATHTTLRMSCRIVPLSNYRTSDCGYGGIDFFDNGKGYVCSAKFYTFKSDASGEYYGLTNDYNGSAQLALISCGGGAGNNVSIFTGTSTTPKLRIDNNASCFSQTVCSPLLIGNGSSQQIMAIGAEADIWMCNTGGGAGLWRLLGSTGNATKLFRIYDGNAGSNRLTIDTNGLVCTPFGVKFGNGSGQLNYYEEGSWTPTLQNATVSYDFRSGSYIRIGNYVFVRWGFRISSISGPSGTVTISGLPFTAVNWGSYQEPNISVSTGILVTADYAQRARVYKGGSDTSLYGRIANNGDTTWQTDQLQNGSWIIGEIFYNVP